MRRALTKRRLEAKEQLRARQHAECPAGFYTRPMLREKLGLTEKQVRSLISLKVLNASGVNTEGVAIYSEQTVQKLINRQADGSLFERVQVEPIMAGASAWTNDYSAEDSADVITLLDEGKPINEIVKKTRIHLLSVKKISDDYYRIIGSIVLPPSIVGQINAMGGKGLHGSFPLTNATDILEVLELASQARLCPQCPGDQARESTSLCFQCAAETTVKHMQEQQALAAARLQQQQQRAQHTHPTPVQPAAPESHDEVTQIPPRAAAVGA
jgi:hypothetical protein